MPTETAGIVARIVTGDQALREDLLRLCAAAAVSAEVVGDPAEAGHLGRPDLVLLGSDAVSSAPAVDQTSHTRVAVVARRPVTEAVWRSVVAVRAEALFVIPEQEQDLVERLSDLVDGTASAAVTIGVLGAHGGAGTSTFAAGLGLTAAADGRRALLIDADPHSGGIELVVGSEDAPGLRWREIAATHGRVGAAALREALPQVDGLAVLSFDREPAAVPEPSTARNMLAAGRRGSDLVVLDLGRRLEEPWTGLARSCDRVLLVAAGEVRAAAAARQAVMAWPGPGSDVRLVVRDRPPSDLSAEEMAECVGLPLVARLPTKRAIARAVDEGAGPLCHRGFESACRDVLNRLVAA